MKASELKPGVEYALGRGDVRRDWWSFRKCIYVERAPVKYDRYNRTKVLNRGDVVVRLIDDPTAPPPTPGYSVRVRDNRVKGSEFEINPKYLIAWTWAELEAEIGEKRREDAAEREREAEIRTYFAEMGVKGEHLNLGRNSLSYYDKEVNMMTNARETLDECNVQLPFGILRKLIAGTEITEEDWK